MAFAYTVTDRGVMGNLKYQIGSFSNGTGDTGGDIVVPFNRVLSNSVSNKSNVDNGIKVVQSDASKKITITTVAGDDGDYIVLGK